MLVCIVSVLGRGKISHSKKPRLTLHVSNGCVVFLKSTSACLWYNKKERRHIRRIYFETISKQRFYTILRIFEGAHEKNLAWSPLSKLVYNKISGRNFRLVGRWADPGGTAMPGQLVTEPEQAPELYPLTKISLISKRTHGPLIRY